MRPPMSAGTRRPRSGEIPVEIFLPPSALSSKDPFSGGHTGGGSGGGGGVPSGKTIIDKISGYYWQIILKVSNGYRSKI